MLIIIIILINYFIENVYIIEKFEKLRFDCGLFVIISYEGLLVSVIIVIIVIYFRYVY